MEEEYTPANLLAYPNREASDARPELEDLFNAAARKVRNRLVNRAGADIPVRQGVTSITTIGEALAEHDSSDGSVFASFHVKPVGLQGLLLVQGQLLHRVVGILLGEDVLDKPSEYQPRSVTALEMKIIRRVCEDVMNGLQSAWPEHKNYVFELMDLSTSVRSTFGLTQNSSVISATLDFGPNNADYYGNLTICLPAQLAKGMKVPRDAPMPANAPLAPATGQIFEVPLEIVAELGTCRVPLDELQTLEVGSTLEIGILDLVTLRVDDKVFFKGEAGAHRGNHAVRITERTEPNG